eukprot:gnl/Chilomastix_cuspidata/1158.p1 GENE.gnl/Chilomastix_cuspidata/1158~~gnl/Chilomastix_cuspidata/1158.p1  ORF type:complete len:140 (-),score=62.00 gnl/Chilomastix_cuspidata/1158:37-456(-)
MEPSRGKTIHHHGDAHADHIHLEENPQPYIQKRSRKKRSETYHTYIYKILRQVHPDIAISSKAMVVMNSIIADIFERVCAQAGFLARVNKKSTISDKEILSSAKLLIPGDLSRHAVTEGKKALEKFASSFEDERRRYKP